MAAEWLDVSQSSSVGSLIRCAETQTPFVREGTVSFGVLQKEKSGTLSLNARQLSGIRCGKFVCISLDVTTERKIAPWSSR